MDFKEKLIHQKLALREAIAFRMWPTNKDAPTYLSRKLKGSITFTKQDEKDARKALKELGIELINLSKSKDITP